MAYTRKEVPAEEVEHQKDICLRIREKLGSGERFALVDTYGCQQNESDSEILRGYLRDMGYTMTEDENKADVIAVNTCAVREHAQMRVFYKGGFDATAEMDALSAKIIENVPVETEYAPAGEGDYTDCIKIKLK